MYLTVPIICYRVYAPKEYNHLDISQHPRPRTKAVPLDPLALLQAAGRFLTEELAYLSTMAWKFLSHSFVMSAFSVVGCGFHVNCCRIPPHVIMGIISPVRPNLT